MATATCRYATLLMVPMVRQNRLIGAPTVTAAR
jgi:hypothetical protein